MAGSAGSRSAQARCPLRKTPEETRRRLAVALAAVAGGAAVLPVCAAAGSSRPHLGAGSARPGSGSALPGVGSARVGTSLARAVLYGLDDYFIGRDNRTGSELVRLDPLTLRRQRQRGPLLGDHVNLAVSPNHSVLAAGSDGHGDLVLLNLTSMRRIARVR